MPRPALSVTFQPRNVTKRRHLLADTRAALEDGPFHPLRPGGVFGAGERLDDASNCAHFSAASRTAFGAVGQTRCSSAHSSAPPSQPPIGLLRIDATPSSPHPRRLPHLVADERPPNEVRRRHHPRERHRLARPFQLIRQPDDDGADMRIEFVLRPPPTAAQTVALDLAPKCPAARAELPISGYPGGHRRTHPRARRDGTAELAADAHRV